jgi:hypothetical protein
MKRGSTNAACLLRLAARGDGNPRLNFQGHYNAYEFLQETHGVSRSTMTVAVAANKSLARMRKTLAEPAVNTLAGIERAFPRSLGRRAGALCH